MTFIIGRGFAERFASLVEALPSSKVWKNENGLISWTEWNVLIDFYVNIDIIKI